MNSRKSSPLRVRWPALLAGFLSAAASLLQAQTVAFDSGSNGSLGDVVITNDTQIVLPADGVLHYKTFAVLDGVAVTFIKNAYNTPVYLLSQGDVVIEGRIFVSGGDSAGDRGPGLGGPGGFDGGRRGVGDLPPGDGQGPGGGRAGNHAGANVSSSAGSGSFLTQLGAGSTNLGNIYGNAALIPLIGGSGGGGTPGFGGGGGGGAILVASATRIRFGSAGNHFIDATGGAWGTGGAYNGGSGGAVKLVAPTVEGPMRINVSNRNGTGGAGRIRIDAVNFSGANFGHHAPAHSLSYGSMLATGLEGTLPRLDLISVAGRVLPTNNVANGFILLPNGVAGEQPVVVRARNFGSQVPVRIVVAPDNGETTYFDGVINNTGATPAEATFNVFIPANSPAKVNVWTR
ncbi:MAG: hypothetical protein J0M24_07645 [Verrucomicrobia bacterium]|nr:hypothetical protein [Verrucomicrobiota bacterium]